MPMAAPPLNILLVNPSSLRFTVPAAPLGLSRLAACLPEEMTVWGMDLNVFKWIFGLDQASILATVENYLAQAGRAGCGPDLIGITVYQETMAEAAAIAGLGRKYGAVTVAGGIQPTLFPDEMPPVFDFLVRGAGEIPFAALIELLDHERSCDDEHHQHHHSLPAGLSYYRPDSGWNHIGPPATAPRQEILPRRDIFDRFNLEFRYYSARVLSSSGCPYACSFCVNSEYARREWLARPAEAVLAEIGAALEDPAVTEIAFSDDQFLGFTASDYRRAFRILGRLEAISRTRNLRVNLQVRADQFLKAVAAVPELAGVLQAINRNFHDQSAAVSVKLHGRPARGLSLDIGIESFLDERLALFEKGLTARDNLDAVRLARKLGLDLGVYMILFTPEITLEQIAQELLVYLKEYLATDHFSKAAFLNFFQELIPYRGTAVHRRLRETGRLVEEEGDAGFRFQDSRVAAFYVLYLYQLQSGELERLEAPEAMLARIDHLLRLAREAGADPELERVLSSVVCELKDPEWIGELYDRIAVGLAI
jgi:radical SAM superfamily enzyme YgiQ (UPF0313 family)